MGRKTYSIDLCRALRERILGAGLHVPHRPTRYETGDVLDLSFTTVWPEFEGSGRFRIESFAGGGFAGQVYRCRLESVACGGPPGVSRLDVNAIYAVKIMIPPTRFSRAFRNAIYWLAFQGAFSAQVNRGACRAGLLWPLLVRRAMARITGQPDSVSDVYATFYDPALRAFGEIREWVEGRTWRLEPDLRPGLRRRWRAIDAAATDSPEFVAKRQFMWRLVGLLHDMGAPELARQYEWWTMKSQPNVLKRESRDAGPADGLCAVDFRAGLALLPWLPMSVGDFALVWAGLRRGSIAQFDRCDYAKLDAFLAAYGTDADVPEGLVESLKRYDAEYRRSLPDVFHQGFRLLLDAGLRLDVRRGLTRGYWTADLVDDAFAARLPGQPARFAAFYLLGAIPLLGRFVRRVWGNAAFRRHLAALVRERGYWRRSVRAGVAARLSEWHRGGRVSEARARRLADRPASFWLQRCTVGLLPAGLHRALAEPRVVWGALCSAFRFLREFYRDAAFREDWLCGEIESGYKEGMLDERERDEIMERIGDPFIVKYLKCLAVHFATLPVTQIVSVSVGAAMAIWLIATGKGVGVALVAFGAVLAFFQVTPISPGSLCRGFYVVYLVWKERDFRDYLIALPLSFVKYIGYLAFPFQMITTYPALARFMGSRWATGAVHIVPIFGEKGALLEHMVFDLFFNRSRVFGAWACRRLGALLTLWAFAGMGLLAWLTFERGVSLAEKSGLNALIAVLAVCVLPRVLFYPMLRRKGEDPGTRR
jgi:hypothetical protein